MRTNTKATNTKKTHEGAPALPSESAEAALRRSVLACFLWENQFYEDGVSIADRIVKNANAVSVQTLADIAVEARNVHNLRHVPLLLLCVLAERGRGSSIVRDTVAKVVKRPDEITELLSLYWADGKKPISHQLKKGLAAAFNSFDAYQLAKYNRKDNIKLRDVAFLTHTKASDKEKGRILAKLLNKEYLPERTKSAGFPVKETYGDEAVGLESPDTWEVALSGGADKKETFTRLLKEGKLGYMALLRNLRNMQEAGVDSRVVNKAIKDRKGADRVLPFRFLAAAKAAPQYEKALDAALIKAVEGGEKYDGETIVLVDNSGSMQAAISAKSQISRADAAAMMGALVDGDVRCFSFATDVKEVPHRIGMAGVDAFQKADVGWGTYVGQAISHAAKKYPNAKRIIVITDEQGHDQVNLPKGMKGYMINVASYENGIGYGKWTRITGFSSNVIKYIQEIEKEG